MTEGSQASEGTPGSSPWSAGADVATDGPGAAPQAAPEPQIAADSGNADADRWAGPRSVCPYCGAEREAGGARCDGCGGMPDPLSRQATQNEMGPWFVRDERSPFLPGCSMRTLRRWVRTGRLRPESVLRGPSTGQFWLPALRVPGVARLFGRCHSCELGVGADDSVCGGCGATLDVEDDRQYLGLGAVREIRLGAVMPAAPNPTPNPTSAPGAGPGAGLVAVVEAAVEAGFGTGVTMAAGAIGPPPGPVAGLAGAGMAAGAGVAAGAAGTGGLSPGRVQRGQRGGRGRRGTRGQQKGGGLFGLVLLAGLGGAGLWWGVHVALESVAPRPSGGDRLALDPDPTPAGAPAATPTPTSTPTSTAASTAPATVAADRPQGEPNTNRGADPPVRPPGALVDAAGGAGGPVPSDVAGDNPTPGGPAGSVGALPPDPWRLLMNRAAQTPPAPAEARLAALKRLIAESDGPVLGVDELIEALEQRERLMSYRSIP